MPAVQSKNQAEDLTDEKRKKMATTINVHVFLSICQHVITLQSEVMLVRELCKDDVAATAQMLSNSSGLIGLLSLFVNQAGGKLSDSTGRKPYLLLGPLGNVIWGLLVCSYPQSKAVVLFCRIARSVLTTFSNTVMVSAVMADVFSGKDLAMASSKVAAVIGVGIVVTPIFETLILQRAKHPRYTYLALSSLAAVHLLYNSTCFCETLAAKPVCVSRNSQLAALNPFGFLSIYTRGSQLLKRLVTITSLQMFLEGKNLSDIVEIWKRSHLKWTIEGSRNFVVTYGVLCVVAGALLTPPLLSRLSARNFTSLTNHTNALGFFLRGAAERSWVFLLAMLPLLPGVNGASASALKALSADLAAAEGFGKGEFSAWTNNLRALSGSAAPVLFGQCYAWCLRRGIYPGSVFALAGFIGALLPEALLRRVDADELRAAEGMAAAAIQPPRPLAAAAAAGAPREAK